ncbi:hypothetical protein H6785_03730 [Candidatus Nomurabacteria bacterium]|nr:hypothetical protein [Candidatus Kaiserbacteria bacterium]MCB9815658.1 hypothetical protein [Candidatus Nomurabacteria bacterium]
MNNRLTLTELLYKIITETEPCQINPSWLTEFDESRHSTPHEAPLPALHLYKTAVELLMERNELADKANFMPADSTERNLLVQEIYVIDLHKNTLWLTYRSVLSEYLVTNGYDPYDNYEIITDYLFAGIKENIKQDRFSKESDNEDNLPEDSHIDLETLSRPLTYH